MNNHHSKIFQLITLLLFLLMANIHAQEKAAITGTNLKIVLPENFILDENIAAISNHNCTISFMEMDGVNYTEQLSDFENIEANYAEKGIKVSENYKGKIGKYDAQHLLIDSSPPMHQIFFGDDSFSGLINILANGTEYILNKDEIESIFSTLEYVESTLSPLEEHANFTLSDDNEDWKFVSYTMSMFAFENNVSKDGIMLMQLPAETLLMGSEKDLVNQFVTKLKTDMPTMKVMEEGTWKVNNLDGYRAMLDLGEGANEHLGLIYLFVFGSKKSTFVMQGMGKKNDAATQELFGDFLKGLTLNE